MSREKKYKKCSRCNAKNVITAYRCNDCGCIFSRVESGSNSLAKTLILSGKKNETVLKIGFAKDVNKTKFLLLCGFLGLFGAHNFYVGRFKKAIFQLLFGLLALAMTTVISFLPVYDNLFVFVCYPIGIDVFMWFFDFCDAVFNRYKMPVAVDFGEGGK